MFQVSRTIVQRVLAFAAISVALLVFAACGSSTLPSSANALLGDSLSQAHATTQGTQNQQSKLQVIVRTVTVTVPDATENDIAASCLTGEVATGGGGAIGGGGITNAYITTSGPYPSPSNPTKNPTAWHVIATNLSGSSQPMTVWVLCSK